MNALIRTIRRPGRLAVLAAVLLAIGLSFASGASAAEKTPPTKPATAAAKIDINSATKAELATLPGIGDVYSQKIIDGRPYKGKNELVSKKILPQGVYDKIAPLIIAHQK